jgi:hypothetical protein
MKTESKANGSNYFEQNALKNPQFFANLAVFAIISNLLYLASIWFLPIFSEFSLTGDYISELALGRYGFVQIAAFFISGLGIIGLAYAVQKLTTDSWGNFIGLLLIAIYGIGAIIVAIFPTDRIESVADIWSLSTNGMIHSITAFIGSISILLAMIILSWKFRKDARWRSLVVWSALLSTAAFSLSFAQTASPLVGLMQRFLATVISLWLILTAFRVRSIALSGKENDGREDGQFQIA